MNARTLPSAALACIGSSAQLRDYLEHRQLLPHPHLGEVLAQQGMVSSQHLAEALAQQRAEGADHRRLGRILVERGALREADLDVALVDLLGIPRVQLKGFDFDLAALFALPADVVRANNVLPIALAGEELVVATATPLDAAATERLRFAAQRPILPAFAPAEEIAAAIEVAYAAQIADEDIRRIASAVREHENIDDEHAVWQEAERLAQERPVVRVVNALISEAVQMRASDIHVLPKPHSVEIFFRVDGSLVRIREVQRSMLPTLVSRIKIIARLNIAERRLPQDGHATAEIGHARIDLRVSTIPTRFGESVVIRILDKHNVVRAIDELGMSPRDERALRDLVARSHGMLLVTGPTGSGKTTTLYAALRELMRSNLCIVSCEDPVEYELPGVRQIQLLPQHGFGFPQALRHILRHDPDVIMIGEIRDAETCRLAVESALTGHLVLSTLHTNDAPATLVRLAEMGLEPYLVKSAVSGVLAQRLVRRNCPHCLEPEPVDELLRRRFGAHDAESFYRGRGCRACHDTGFAGRVALYELMPLDEPLRELAGRAAAAEELRRAAIASGMVPLLASGLELARSRAMSLAEVYRACA
jgi:type IV pilus assembly protein PilB